MKFSVMNTALCILPRIFKHSVTYQTLRRTVQKACLGNVFNYSAFALGVAKCEGMLVTEQEKAEGFTHEQCIKQACVQSVNSTTTLLTTTAFAVLDVCKKYKESLTNLLGLLEGTLLIDGESPELWDTIIAARLEVNKKKAALTELNVYMETVEKVVNSTTEAAFLVGAEYMCTVLCERMHSVQQEINSNMSEIKKLEEEYLKVQLEMVKSSKNEGKYDLKTLKVDEEV